jgi:hypothetical protein
VSPVRYELGFYISEDGILHSHRRENLKSYTVFLYGEATHRNIHLVFLSSVRRLLVAACVVPSAPIFVTLIKEAPGSSETSVITRATRRNNPEDTILHSHRREILASFIALTG